jgi:hypothetical protein
MVLLDALDLCFEQPDRRQMVVAIVSDKAVILFMVRNTVIELY